MYGLTAGDWYWLTDCPPGWNNWAWAAGALRRDECERGEGC